MIKHPHKNWIQSHSALKIHQLALTPEAVKLEDIAHALSLKCRFEGQCREFYSVAQHCVLGAQLLPPSYQLAFLLHEVSEVYLPDLVGPLKRHVWIQMPEGEWIPWVELEAHHATVILQALGHSSLFPLLGSSEVKSMDWRMLAVEAERLHAPPPEPWDLPLPPAPVEVHPWSPGAAEAAWMDMYATLTTEPGHLVTCGPLDCDPACREEHVLYESELGNSSGG